MKKRILAFLMAVVMMVGLLPMSALATETANDTVYISVSHDGQYVDDKTGNPVAYIPVAMSKLEAIDLDEYGLGDYLYDADGDGSYEITALHLYIYTHENIMGLDWDDARVSGGAGSIFFEGGLFGFTDCNLQYYCNGEYPAVDGWGVTADQLVLKAGDFLDIAAYTSWAFYGDSATGFHYFLDSSEITHEYTATAGEPLTVTLGRALSSMDMPTELATEGCYNVYYGSALGAASGSVPTDGNGDAEITFSEAGTYYLWVDGGYGAENPYDIVSSPACAKVTVEAGAEPEPEPAFDGVTVYFSEMTDVGAGGYYASIPAGKDLKVVFGDSVSVASVLDAYTYSPITYSTPEAGQFVITANDMQNVYASDAAIAAIKSYHHNAIQNENSEVLYLFVSEGSKYPMLVIEVVSDEEPTPEPASYTVTLPTGEGYTVTAARDSVSPVTEGGSYSFIVSVSQGYDDSNLVVKANDTVLSHVNGIYTIENITADQTITVEGVKKTYTVTLPTGEGYTVTAARDSVSPVIEGGSYSFIVSVAQGYDDSKMEVKVNDASIAHVDGIYTISNITADQVVTVTGVEKIPEPALTWQQVMAKTQAYLTAQAEATDPIVGSTSGEWLVLGLARAGVSAEEDFFQGYYENVLEEEIDANGRLDANRSTENSRVILALTALGKDVTNVGGHDLLQGLSDQDFVKKQGINGPVWALIALDSHDYEIPANADPSKQVTREWLVDYILDNQLTTGGWKIQGQSPDDMTPMAVQALAPYYNTNSQVKSLNNSQVNAAVDKALTIMDEMVETTTSPETLSQIIVARSALGLDSEAAVAKLAALAQEDGSFKKGPSDSKANQMSTEQAFYGLVAYDRFRSGKTALYDMSDVEINKVEGDTPQEPIPVTGITLNKSTLTLEVGKTSTLTAAVTPNNATDKTVTWTSSNSGVATVTAQGRVTAVAEGTARITAKAGDVTASCVVTVTAQEVPLDFGLTESQIKGYVTVSFEDFGKRVAGESMDTIYTKALGTIIPATQVPYKTGDTIASVTIRLLDAMDYTSSYQGSVTSGFYLESIGNFTHNGTYYRSFGEFDAGVGSGWMITWNNWFIDKGASEFNVKNGDVIEWQYTCQLGADIGKDVSGDLTAIQAVEDLINAIGTVTKDSGKAIEAARAAYDALTADQKKLVENYSKLTAAEKTYAALLETDHPFTDAIGHWAEDAITFVYKKGLMTGTKADQFSPNTELSRAMLVTILYRMEGEPAVTNDNSFSDVKEGTWYTDAVIWAAENGIVNGVGKDRFAPNNDITREQMAAMLLRYSAYKGYDTTAQIDLSGYTDADQISTWALDALRWANAEGLITGRKADLLVPKGDTTRGETATILMRYLETIA